MTKNIMFCISSVFICISLVFSQNPQSKIYLENGLLKWTDTNEQAAFFGVNYTTPFAYSYRALKQLGISHKEAIDLDVSQFARLELNAYRIHVWDREVSDTLGNLLQNEHLDLLDYLIAKLKGKNISILLTPIAWWGGGWPEPDPPTPGFSYIYSRTELLTEPKARLAQRNYLKQFLNHKNPYTGFTYKDDPDIIAWEICNEPKHPTDTSIVRNYINELAGLIRSEGVQKPVFYNISENWSEKQSAAVFKADIDGISFQWYPTGLVKYNSLKGNFLAHVDHYPIPQIDDPEFTGKTRMVYEFDAADVGQSVMYPAMARSFREAGMQWATMFSYDPTLLAAYNTEYNTHYVNLLYAPQKAISLMIAGNVFRTVKSFQQFGSYPDNTRFEGFYLSWEKNLSELNNGEKFYHSNHTQSNPVDLKKLTHIAGYGSSKLVKTDHQGAYFLDRLNTGDWRLELYPDVVERRDPYSRNSCANKVRVLINQPSEFEFSLPGLTKSFYVKSLLDDNPNLKSNEGKVILNSGVYILSGKELKSLEKINYNYMKRTLKEFPVEDFYPLETEIIHNPAEYVFENSKWNPSFKIISESKIDTVLLYVKHPLWNRYTAMPLQQTDKYVYQAEVVKNLSNGTREYCLYVKTASAERTFPAGIAKKPNDWDFYADEFWQLKIIPEKSSVILFNPSTDLDNVDYPSIWRSLRFGSSVVWDISTNPWFRLDLTEFTRSVEDFTIQIEINEQSGMLNIDNYSYLEFEVDRDISTISDFNVRLINTNYESAEAEVHTAAEKIIQVPLEKLTANELVLLPRPYPHFLPYFFKVNSVTKKKERGRPCFIQISIPINELMLNELPQTLQFGPIRLVR